MTDEPVKDDLLVRYVLGRLNEEEHERVEERMFASREFFERLKAVEDELIDGYASGQLTGDDRLRFEKYFLQSVEDHERIEFARELSAFVARESRARNSKPRFALLAGWSEFLRQRHTLVPVTAAILLALVGSWLLIQTLRLNDSFEKMQIEKRAREERAAELEQQIAEERRRNDQLSQELERERAQLDREIPPAPTPPAPIVSFVLTLGGVRGSSSTTKLTISPEAKQVRLDALFSIGAYEGYRAELQAVEGRVLSERAGLKARRKGNDKVVSLTLPANMFSESDYILVLKGINSAGEEEIVGEYFFRVVKK